MSTAKGNQLKLKDQAKAGTEGKKNGNTNVKTTNTKTIKAPGGKMERIAQACDRCRAKKTKCDGKLPTCSNCAAVGIKCIVSDKLSRRAFPKGYTETLEERIRQLEAANKKLVDLLDIRDEQIEMLNSSNIGRSDIKTAEGSNRVTSDNLDLLNEERKYKNHDHHDHGCPCGCSNPHALHERPVSIAGSVYDAHADNLSYAGSINLSEDDDKDSLLSIEDASSIHMAVPLNMKQKSLAYQLSGSEIHPTPNAFAAATAIAHMQKNKMFQRQQQQLEHQDNKQQMLTSLVAISIPRSTEETLFIPTLLAKVCQVYGYDSKTAIITANAIASLKENPYENPRDSKMSDMDNKEMISMIMNRKDIRKLDVQEGLYFVKNLLKLPQSRVDLDHLITIYFKEWGNIFPILDKETFLKNYVKLTDVLEQVSISGQEKAASSFEQIEMYGANMVMILSLALLSNKNEIMKNAAKPDSNDSYIQLLDHYNYLIHEFIKPSCILTRFCSIQSLQILSLALLYFLVTGDVTTCYELRGRVITMAHQLRLHRCPAAVLGISGNDNGNVDLSNFMQGERRILFWCIYCLDIYSSLNLGVPRLLKDFEIECALPFAGKYDNDKINENILIVNNTRLSIVGKVSRLALNVMLFCKVLGNILDYIFSRSENDDNYSKATSRDGLLDTWRRELPNDLKFELDVNGFSLRDNSNMSDFNVWKNYNKQQLILVFLYYHAKILIYLPIISKYGNNHDIGLSQKEKLTRGEADLSSIVSSISMIQQSSGQILEVLKSFSDTGYVLPIPLNVPRAQAKFSLLVAKGTLDYIKGGPLYQSSRQLLIDTSGNMISESWNEFPGGLTKSSVKLLELAILSILGLNLNKISQRKKKDGSRPVSKAAVSRDPLTKAQLGINKATSVFPVQPANDTDGMMDDLTPSINPSNDLNITNPHNWGNSDEGLGTESIFEFDPFKVNLNNSLLTSEFAADGSLGLVPFLENSDSHLLQDDFETPKLDDSSSSIDIGTEQFQWP